MADNVRDIDADFKAAYLAEYKVALAAGLTDRAAACEAELKRMGVTVGGDEAEKAAPAAHKETRRSTRAKKDDD